MPTRKKKPSSPAALKHELSHTMRDYLTNAWRLGSGAKPVTVTALADAQQVSPASATAMVKKLTRLGLMTHHHYGTIELTTEGQLQALLAIRRHRLLECFLVRMLHFRLDEVHDESEALEPVISDVFEQKIDVALGRPKRCPHGDPIPDVHGVMTETDLGFPLVELEPGRQAKILRVPGSKQELLRYLIDLGVEPERPVCLVKRDPFGGPLHLRLGRKAVMLGPEAAERVYVTYAGA